MKSNFTNIDTNDDSKQPSLYKNRSSRPLVAMKSIQIEHWSPKHASDVIAKSSNKSVSKFKNENNAIKEDFEYYKSSKFCIS